MSVIHSVANLSDHEEILSLTSKDKDFYGGMDYLPHALYNWLVEGSDPGSRRKNLIFLLDQKIIGFMSIYFQKKWTSCVKFAFRISREFRGKGYGQKIQALVSSYLNKNFVG